MPSLERGKPDAGSAGVANETEVRWDQASAFVRRRLEFELPPSSRGLIDDLAQECMVKLLRFVRREPVQNLEALLTQLARRTAIDALRRRTRWSALVSGDEDDVALAADPKAHAGRLGDPLERLQFVVLEYFTAREARCLELAKAYFAEMDWKAVAAAQGRSHDGIRKQWSRCIELLRSAASAESGALFDVLRDE